VTGRRRRHRAAVLLGAALGLLWTSATAAGAHTRTQETTNLDSRVSADPGLPGVRWTVHTGGLLVEVTNRSGEVLIVEGYEGEPYLRIGPDGVAHNRRSPATYLNDPRTEKRLSSRTSVAMPGDVDPAAPPEWIVIDDEPRALWHDHRTHWMSPEPPPFVEAGPISRAMMRANLVGVIGRAGDDAGAFQDWTIAFWFGGEPGVLVGQMRWQDPPSVAPTLLLAGVLVLPGLLGLRRRTSADRLRPAALMVLLVAAANTIHLVDDLIAWPSHPLDELFGVLHTTLFLGVGIGASLWCLRARAGRAPALAIASGAVLYHQGVVHLPMLQASQFPTVWPPGVVRLTVALGLVQAVVVAIVLVGGRRQGRRPSVADAPDRPVDARAEDAHGGAVVERAHLARVSWPHGSGQAP
jgi:hypothetical protein